MSDTTVSPNNTKIAFRGKAERERALPRHVKRKVNKLKRQGLISEKAAQRIG